MGLNKYLKDSNPGALEKAVDSFIEFAKKADKSIISELIPAYVDLVVSKSISHLKPVLQEKGMEAICCVLDNTEEFEIVSEGICKTVKGANVKVRLITSNTLSVGFYIVI